MSSKDQNSSIIRGVYDDLRVSAFDGGEFLGEWNETFVVDTVNVVPDGLSSEIYQGGLTDGVQLVTGDLNSISEKKNNQNIENFKTQKYFWYFNWFVNLSFCTISNI